MTEIWLHLSTAFGITAPLVLVAVVGVACRSAGLIDQHFVHSASRLVFNISLPCLLFVLVFNADWQDGSGLLLIAFSLFNTLSITALALVAARYLVKESADRGVFVQGVFRSNMGIISLALVSSAYGAKGLELAAVPITLNTLLYNVLAVIILSQDSTEASGTQARKQAYLGILRNPLILAIATGLLAALLEIKLPSAVETSLDLLSQLALPVALLCVGASLKFSALYPPDRVATWASIGKLFVAPAIACSVAHFGFGMQGMPLGVLFFMTGSPAATASFAMVVGFGGNATLSAQIIALTTLGAVLSIGLGTFALNYWGLM